MNVAIISKFLDMQANPTVILKGQHHRSSKESDSDIGPSANAVV